MSSSESYAILVAMTKATTEVSVSHWGSLTKSSK